MTYTPRDPEAFAERVAICIEDGELSEERAVEVAIECEEREQ